MPSAHAHAKNVMHRPPDSIPERWVGESAGDLGNLGPVVHGVAKSARAKQRRRGGVAGAPCDAISYLFGPRSFVKLGIEDFLPPMEALHMGVDNYLEFGG